ncbi:hypothetical protein ES707_21406 [subsurface metagenome]
MKSTKTVVAIILIIASIAVAIIFIIVASKQPLTQLEIVSLQVFILFLGLLGSFIFGRQSAINAAREIIKPHARSAFRRVLSLYQSLSRLASTIDHAKSSNSNSMEEKAVLDKLQAIVTEQIATADDALEDWRDIVPDDVDELRKKLGDKGKKEVQR